jgi:hypothetical protein
MFRGNLVPPGKVLNLHPPPPPIATKLLIWADFSIIGYTDMHYEMSVFVFWIVTPCGLVGRQQLFGGTYCLNFLGYVDKFTAVRTSNLTSIKKLDNGMYRYEC